MECEDEKQMPDMRRPWISDADKLPSIDQMPVFSFQYYRRAMFFHWLIGCACGMGLGLMQIRLWPQHAIWFLAVQGVLLGYALRFVILLHFEMKRRRAEINREGERFLTEMATVLKRVHPDDPKGNAEKVALVRKTMGL